MNVSLPPINQVDLAIDHQELALVSQAIEQRWLTEGKFTKALIEKIQRKLDIRQRLPRSQWHAGALPRLARPGLRARQ